MIKANVLVVRSGVIPQSHFITFIRAATQNTSPTMGLSVASFSSKPPSVREFLVTAAYDDLLLLVILLAGGLACISRGTFWDLPDPYRYKLFERPQAGEATSNGGVSKAPRNIATKLAETSKQVVIFWGSQSGTAEGFAHQLARDCSHRLNLGVLVADVSDYDHDTLAQLSPSQYAIFIMSTFGEGDPSDNSTGFLRLLKSESGLPSLTNLRFTAFGCGNSNYKYYNAVVDQVVSSLQDRGATMFLPIGKADDAKGTTHEDFEDWKTTLIRELRTQLGLVETESVYTPTISVVMDKSICLDRVWQGEPPFFQAPSDPFSRSSSPVVPLPVSSTRELTTASLPARSCVHLELDLSGHPKIKYKTGDYVAVRPTNPTTEVNALIEVLGLIGQEKAPIVIHPVDPLVEKTTLPSPTNLLALFRHHLEICAPVSRETVLTLAHFASTRTAKDYLANLGSDKASYTEFLGKNHITLSRLLRHVHEVDSSVSWTGLPRAFVVESLRPLKARYYSISSSSVISPRRATLTVANNPHILPGDGKIAIAGVARTYLSSFVAPSTPIHPHVVDQSPPLSADRDGAKPLCHASICRSTFKLPASPTTPLILICAGSGIAPFRAFLYEYSHLANLYGSTRPVGRTILFFGCRHPDQDLLYKDELSQLQSSPHARLEIVHAFSRVEGQPKTYVQDRVEERCNELVKLLLEEGAALYICGSAAMAREVGNRIGDGIKRAKDCDEEGLKKWRGEQKRSRKWQEDVWG
ncbi:uncharacterized protein PV06_08367 [Exophiala oligosperma]|uniref:NADPH--hemoprotein reductase n=1 Tax=Exophiala oligosperma TaxID=215243 RepID=A0A0D2BQJ0_9EURO|nr:uncharacterized protein PV06_08367 [Exophiala oligosperma]KIW39782.1 hypothetical protein PV06_08367 [Exophiala oligosperma]